MKRIILKPGEEQRIRAGHPWVYDNEVDRIANIGANPSPVVLLPGETADVESSRKEYLGRAFVNPKSKITARIYSPSKEGADKGFFKRRIREALLRRTAAGYDLTRDSARIVFAEADFLPGLIVDRFVGWSAKDIFEKIPRPDFDDTVKLLGPPDSWLSVQFLCYGIDSRREEILAALEETLGSGEPFPPRKAPLGAPAGIVEKSAHVRELEGLPLTEGLVRGNFPEEGIVIFENGFPFLVNLVTGQKTGHFLDQKNNRLLAAQYGMGGKQVLDVCAYTGGFAIHAARLGANRVTAVDVSAAALETLKKNAALNGVAPFIETVEADVFDVLKSYEHKKEKFDLIILDPPAFAKSRSSLEGALRGYKEINLRAIRLLSPGGVLVSCSCSQALDEAGFKRMIAGAAADAERRLVQIDFRYQAPDHPILVGYDESFYLKCGFYRAL
ncbi:MAG: class I SAM-dependent rRNA methyltransferase [Treponema sp.]|jgi:23S rRNA (cytosine1962-C5)-methyltransferase|nr:class I SAM-dependent rRNA methyltransferase [Treponema sp.]